MKGRELQGLKIGRKTSLAIKQIREAKETFKGSEYIANSTPCECCGLPTEGYCDICSRCGWEQVCVEWDNKGGNPISLKAYQKLFMIYGTK